MSDSKCDFARVYVDYYVDSDHTRLHVVSSSVDDALAEIITRKQHDSILSHASDYTIERFDLERALCELIIEQNDLAAERAIFATRLHKIDCAHRDVDVAMSARKRCECRDVAYLHHVREARFSTRVQDLKRMMTLNMITDDD